MFRKLTDFITTASGDPRLDAKFLGGKIAQRCGIALKISGDEGFRTFGRDALSMRSRAEDEERCTLAECRVILKALIELEKSAVLLEITHGLRNRVSDIIRQGYDSPSTDEAGTAGAISPNDMNFANLCFMQLINNVEPFPKNEFNNLEIALESLPIKLKQVAECEREFAYSV
jgi:hypothetical protein